MRTRQAQVEHPAAPNHHVGPMEEMLRRNRPDVALAGTEHHGGYVHARFDDQTSGECLAADVASGRRGDVDEAAGVGLTAPVRRC